MNNHRHELHQTKNFEYNGSLPICLLVGRSVVWLLGASLVVYIQ